jgi:hypothetical protein
VTSAISPAHPRVGRQNAGRSVLTARDLAALRWIGEQYTARLDVVALLLSRLAPEPVGLLSRRTVRQRITRWEQAGWISRHRLLGHTWITPTVAGLRHAASTTSTPGSPPPPG